MDAIRDVWAWAKRAMRDGSPWLALAAMGIVAATLCGVWGVYALVARIGPTTPTIEFYDTTVGGETWTVRRQTVRGVPFAHVGLSHFQPFAWTNGWISESGKRHGPWIASHMPPEWYWYGEPISEGDWALRTAGTAWPPFAPR